MPHQKCKTVYFYDELDDKAKEKAREWFRQDYPDCYWWDSSYEDFVNVGELLGITFDSNKKASIPIWFTGFYHQGSGSSFDGTWYATDVKADKLKAYASTDKELHRLADIFDSLAKENPELSATIKSKRDTWITVDVEHGETRDEVLHELADDSEWQAENAKDDARAEALEKALRDFNRWIFRTLEKEYEYLTSEEHVAEEIRANEYEFTEDGHRA